MIPLDRPHAWDAHVRALPAIQSHGGSRGAHGAARLLRSDSTAATDTALSTPMRPSPCAPHLPRDALGSLFTRHMRGDLGGASLSRAGAAKSLCRFITDSQRFITDTLA